MSSESEVFESIAVKELLVSSIDTGGSGTDISIKEDFAFVEGKNIVVGTSSGTRFSTTASQKIAFHGSTPIVQAVLATGSTNDQIITALQTLGLVKQS